MGNITMKSPLKNTLLLAGAFFCLFLSPAPSEAFVASVKSMGRAGAVVAQPLDSLVAAYNPAGLAFVGNRWDLGVSVVKEDGDARFSGNDTFNQKISSHDYDIPMFLPEFGVNQNICECQYEYAFTLGFVVYSRESFKTKFERDNPLFGTSKARLEYLHYVAAPTFSINFGCDHAFGITADFHGHRLKVNGLENFNNSTYSKKPGKVTNKGFDCAGGIGFTVGWISRLSHWATIGLAWSPEVKMGRLNDYEGLLAKKGKLDIPARYIGGLAIDLACGVTLEFDVEHINYSHINSLNNSFLHNDDTAPFFGKDHGSGWGWKDQTIYRIGAEWELYEGVSTRIGYWRTQTPVRASQALFNSLIPNIVEEYITLGASNKFDWCNELSFYIGYGWNTTISGSGAIPTSLGGGKVTLDEKKWLAGISWGRYF